MVVTLVEPDQGVCQMCKATKRFLDKRNIPYNVFKSSEKQELVNRLHVKQAPLVTVEDKDEFEFWTGYNPDKLKQLVSK